MRPRAARMEASMAGRAVVGPGPRRGARRAAGKRARGGVDARLLDARGHPETHALGFSRPEADRPIPRHRHRARRFLSGQDARRWHHAPRNLSHRSHPSELAVCSLFQDRFPATGARPAGVRRGPYRCARLPANRCRVRTRPIPAARYTARRTARYSRVGRRRPNGSRRIGLDTGMHSPHQPTARATLALGSPRHARRSALMRVLLAR